MARATHRAGPFATGGHRGLTVRKALPATRTTSSRVIVILKNQYNAVPATKRKVGTRIRAEKVGNARIMTQVKHAGGSVYRQYHALNAFAAKVSANERTALSRDSAVKQVIPDTVVKLPGPIGAPAVAGASKAPRAAGAAGPSTPNGQQLCPADPSKPLLEPEALQTTHTAFDDPSTPQAQNLATGAGVTVAFFADGLDINNPDFIRPDGSHVITDYQDFSGDGLNAPTNSLEAFGDASSIAAQGTVVHDISQFVNPAHPLPAGCNITVRGVAPGASMVAMKVFGDADSAFNSTILEGLDYALTHDHPNVFSESFGGYPIPDSTQDLTRQFNQQAVAAGATVVESTGDSGVESSPSSASSDPSVIAAGASTTFRNYAQGTQYGFQFAKGWLSDNISSIESAGFTQGGRVLDLVAPGEANWAVCSKNTAMYQGCVDFKNAPTDLESFGGTSESAPLIAGGAALIIQAYRGSHGGATPSPALVRQLLTSTATDLRAPSFEEGSGEMNTLAAVQAARAVGNAPSSANGNHLLVGPTQLDISQTAGTTATRSVKVTNLGATTQIVHAQARQIAKTVRQPDRLGQPDDGQPDVRRPVRLGASVRDVQVHDQTRHRQVAGVRRVERPGGPRRDGADRPERQLRRLHPSTGRRQPRRGRRGQPGRRSVDRDHLPPRRHVLGAGQLADAHAGLRLGRLPVAVVAVDRAGQEQDVPGERQAAQRGR